MITSALIRSHLSFGLNLLICDEVVSTSSRTSLLSPLYLWPLASLAPYRWELTRCFLLFMSPERWPAIFPLSSRYSVGRRVRSVKKTKNIGGHSRIGKDQASVQRRGEARHQGDDQTPRGRLQRSRARCSRKRHIRRGSRAQDNHSVSSVAVSRGRLENSVHRLALVFIKRVSVCMWFFAAFCVRLRV